MLDKRVSNYNVEGFQQPVPSLFLERVRNENIISIPFLQLNSATYGLKIMNDIFHNDSNNHPVSINDMKCVSFQPLTINIKIIGESYEGCVIIISYESCRSFRNQISFQPANKMFGMFARSTNGVLVNETQSRA